ncbi:hypothetical protein Tco_0614014 [Tanacetum coccineum]
MISLYNLCTDFVKFADMALPHRDQRHLYLRFEGLEYTNADIEDFGERLGKIYERGVHRVHVFDFRGLTDLMAKGFEVRGLLVHELILEFFSTFRFREAVLDLDTVRALQFQLGEVRRRISCREFILGIASEGDFLGTTSSYTTIRDLMLRGIDVGSVNILLFFGKVFEEICFRKEARGDDIWRTAWLAPGPERRSDVAAGAPEVAHIHASQLPPAAGPARTLPQRVARLEEEVYGLRGSMAEQRDVLDSMAHDFSRRRTDDASTSAPQQPDP